METLAGCAAGVPYLALPPERDAAAAPLIVAWHLHDPPRSEIAMAAALPMRGIPAWRVYLGLPFCGSRLPPGGLDAFLALGYDDAVLKLFEPTVRLAVAEFPPALAELRRELSIRAGSIGLVGGSIGALVALSVLTDTDIRADAACLVSPAIRLAGVVAANERRFAVTYPWTDASRAVARQLDFLARADQIRRTNTALLLAVGELDDEAGIKDPARQLHQALATNDPDRAELITIPAMGHAFADAPGLEAAPQTAQAAQVSHAFSDWFRRHLRSAHEPRSD